MLSVAVGEKPPLAAGEPEQGQSRWSLRACMVVDVVSPLDRPPERVSKEQGVLGAVRAVRGRALEMAPSECAAAVSGRDRRSD